MAQTIALRGAYTAGGSANYSGTGLHFSLSSSGAQANDVAIAVLYCRANTKTVTNVSGVTQLQYTSTANGGMIWVGVRVLDATDISNGYFGTFDLSSVSNGTGGYVVDVFSGVDTTSPVRASATPVSGGTGNTPDPPSLTITSGDTVVCCYGKMDDDAGTHTPPTNYTMSSATQYWSSTSGTDGCSGIAYRLAVAATSEDPGTFTTGAGGLTTYWYADTLCLVPGPDLVLFSGGDPLGMSGFFGV